MGAAYASSRPWLTNVTDPATGNSTLPLDLVPEYLDYKEEICMGITLITGVMMVVLGLFKLGFITYYLSDSFFAAFTSAAGLHIGVSQLPGMLGIQIPQFSGMFKIIHSCRAIIDGVSNVNWASLIISVIVCIVVQLFKDCVNERFKHKLPAPIPTELLVVIVATVISHLGEFQENFGVKVVGQVPNYFSAPVLPTTGLKESEAYIKDCFVLAILIFAYTIAVAKICAKKHNYEVDNSQEMIAYGMCNLLTSFLKCFPTCVAPSRSMVASNMNAKTILNGVYSVVLMLLFVLFVGPLLEALPRASLAAIIFISLKVLVVQILDCRKFWRVNKLDFVIWLFTFFSTTFLDIDYGLLIGFCVSVLTIIIQGQLVRGDRLGRTGSTSVMAEVQRYEKTSEIAGVMIFRFQSSLFFANAEIFRSRLYHSTVNPRKLLKFLRKGQKGVIMTAVAQSSPFTQNSGSLKEAREMSLDAKESHEVISEGQHTSISIIANSVLEDVGDRNWSPKKDCFQNDIKQAQFDSADSGISSRDEADELDEYGEVKVSEEKLTMMRTIHHVIIDCTPVNYIDSSGCSVLSQIVTEYSHVGIKVFLAGCPAGMLRTLKITGVLDKVPREHVFIDLEDAITVAKNHKVVALSAENLNDFPDNDSYMTKM